MAKKKGSARVPVGRRGHPRAQGSLEINEVAEVAKALSGLKALSGKRQRPSASVSVIGAEGGLTRLQGRRNYASRSEAPS
jgi:hypothetical protein